MGKCAGKSLVNARPLRPVDDANDESLSLLLGISSRPVSKIP